MKQKIGLISFQFYDFRLIANKQLGIKYYCGTIYVFGEVGNDKGYQKYGMTSEQQNYRGCINDLRIEFKDY